MSESAAAQNDWDAEEYEEISSEEVDRVVAALEQLIETVESVNIQNHLDEALNNIYSLFYDDESEEDEVAEAA